MPVIKTRVNRPEVMPDYIVPRNAIDGVISRGRFLSSRCMNFPYKCICLSFVVVGGDGDVQILAFPLIGFRACVCLLHSQVCVPSSFLCTDS